MTCSESYLTNLDRSEWERGNCSTSVDYKWTSVTALSPLSIKYKFMWPLSGICRYHPARCVFEENIMQTCCCADMDLSYHSPLWFFKGYLFTGTLVYLSPPSVHTSNLLLQLMQSTIGYRFTSSSYMSHLHQFGGG